MKPVPWGEESYIFDLRIIALTLPVPGRILFSIRPWNRTAFQIISPGKIYNSLDFGYENP